MREPVPGQIGTRPAQGGPGGAVTGALAGRLQQLLSREGILRGIVGVGAMQGVKLASMLLVSALLARALGPDGYGVFMHVSAIVFVAAIPVAAGLPNLLVRETARYEHDKRWDLLAGLLRRAHQFVIFASVLVVPALSAWAVYHGSGDAEPFWPVLAISLWAIPFLALSGLRSGTLRGLRLPMAGNTPEFFVRPVAYLLAVLAMIALGRADPRMAAYAQLGSIVLSFLAGSLILRHFRPAMLANARPAYATREWFGAWLPFTLLAGVSTANLQIGMVLVGWLSDNVQAGYFAVALVIGNVVMIPLQVVNNVVAPHFARFFRQGDHSGLQRMAHQSPRIALLVSVPGALVFILLGRGLIEFAFGARFLPAYWPMVILVCGQLFNNFAGSAGQILNMSGNERITTVAIAIGVLVTIALSALLVPDHGAIGATIAMAASLVTWNTILVAAAWYRAGVRSMPL